MSPSATSINVCFRPFYLLPGGNAARPPVLEGTTVQVSRHFQQGEFPSSHHREEGVAERSRKYRAASAFARTGWCSDRWDKEHHPGGFNKEASRHFLGDAATPPRGDARRGIRSFSK